MEQPEQNLSEMSTSTRYALNPNYFKFEIQKFKGSESTILIQQWFVAYELLAEHFEWENRAKLIHLANYLEDEALNWFLTNLTSYLTYEDAKQNLTDQFSERIIYPLGQAMKVKYDPEKGIKGYFDAIRRYGTLANLKQNEVSDLNLN